MTTTGNAKQPDTMTFAYAGRCIIGCDWDDPEGDLVHGPYCERLVGSRANAVTEPGWERTQFWCTVISAYLQGEMSRADVRDAYEYRDGVQLTASVAGTIRPQESQPGWQAVSFNLTPAEARQLAAQLVAAADSPRRNRRLAHTHLQGGEDRRTARLGPLQAVKTPA
jgi:hypothetical protein